MPSLVPSPPAAVAVLSAMVVPVVLVLASSSLILATSQRLSRSMERARKVAERLSALRTAAEPAADAAAEGGFLYEQLTFAARRARLLQRAMTLLYLTLASFVGTILVLGVVSTLRLAAGWPVLLLSLGGALLLFAASVLLILESRLALRAVEAEMHYQVTAHTPRVQSSASETL